MSKSHEYIILKGLNRALIGRYLSIAAATVSSTIVFTLLTLVDFAQSMGWAYNLPPVLLSALGAGTVYTALYWIFDKRFWRHSKVAPLLKVPDLSGRWECNGQTLNPDKSIAHQWEAEITIVQSWDKIRVKLRTAESGSDSVAAALTFDDVDGYTLMYNYENKPNVDTDLRLHRGFAEIRFKNDLLSGEGEYFNGLGRFTFGKMSLKKVN